MSKHSHVIARYAFFAVIILSTALLVLVTVASAQSDATGGIPVNQWIPDGAKSGLLGCLISACVVLWKALREERKLNNELTRSTIAALAASASASQELRTIVQDLRSQIQSQHH